MLHADAIAITGYTIFINIAVTGGGGSDGWAIAHGPLSIVFGILAGMGASLIAAPTKLWNNAYKRTCVILILGEWRKQKQSCVELPVYFLMHAAAFSILCLRSCCSCAALVMKFFFDKFNFTSGGALGSLTLGLVIKEIWARGWPAFACNEGTFYNICPGVHLTLHDILESQLDCQCHHFKARFTRNGLSQYFKEHKQI